MITIKNKDLTAMFSRYGAELKSLRFGEREYIWQGDETFWAESSPVLFPICSGLKGDTYFFDGIEYNMPKHGFAKNMLFDVCEKNDNSATFLLTENKETKKYYPFDFEFKIKYTLTDKKLTVKYTVVNKSAQQMYFSVGAHEGYSCPEGIENYEIVFDEEKTLSSCILCEDGTLGYKKEPILKDGKVLPLKYSYFDIDALIFDRIDFNSLVLKNKKTKEKIRVNFKDFPYLLIWTVPDAPYLCIEPWCGITDREGTDKNIKTKEGIECLLPEEIFEREHSIEILEENS
ncbi:MAG: aldose 1-epimerase family protein [Clostridia bacterium]|nr:aldose 1-epimerase family protein [Clostridia bacterium]